VVRSAEFQALGPDVVPPMFVAHRARQHTRVTARLRIATLVADQLRGAADLLEIERRGPHPGKVRIDMGKLHFLEPLGDVVLDTPPQELLARLDPLRPNDVVLEGAAKLDRHLRGEDEMRQALLSAYGYDDLRFTHGGVPLRAHVRLAICLAADATFTPYACGIKAACEFRQATLRVDLRSVSRAIWAWATASRGLSRALFAARLDGHGVIAGFPAFESAYRRALHYQLDTGLEDEEQDRRITGASSTLADLATEGLVYAGEPGRTGDGNISHQISSYLVAEHPEWVPDELAADPEEAFAVGAADLVSEALAGLRSAEETADMLDTIAAELRQAQRQRDTR
jgi:hypothetical protein